MTDDQFVLEVEGLCGGPLVDVGFKVARGEIHTVGETSYESPVAGRQSPVDVTPVMLDEIQEQVEEAEDYLRTLGLVEFRVRHHETLARIEVHAEDIEKITAEPQRSQIIEKLKSIGFKYVAVDLQGFRSGSLNESLSDQDKRTNR